MPARKAGSRKKPRSTSAGADRLGAMTRRLKASALAHDVAKALTSTLQLDQILKIIMEKIQEGLHPDIWSLFLKDEKTNELYCQIATGAGASKLKEIRLQMGQGIAGWVAETGLVAIVPDVSADTRFYGQVDRLTQMRTQSVIAVPIRSRNRILGVIEILNYVGRRKFDDDDLLLLQDMADYVAIALENSLLMQKVHELTITDDCTVLYNARHLHSVIEQEIYRSARYKFEFTLLFLDLDHFKAVNDVHGHLLGSKLLREVADTLRASLRMIDYAFRYGGDEFVVLLSQTGKEAAFISARRLLRTLQESVFLKEEGLNLCLTASMGLASYPADATTHADLIRQADEAMYLVKNSSRNAVAAAGVGLLA